jgi:hypothetical protein
MGNNPNPVDLLEQHFAGIINAMKSSFSFHDFVRKLAHCHQHEYIAALAYYDREDRPFQALHADLERRLHRGPYGLVLVDSHRESTNIFGISATCGEWQKP